MIEKSAFAIDDDYNFDDETPRSDLSDRIESFRGDKPVNNAKTRSNSVGKRPVSNSMYERPNSNARDRRRTTVTKTGYKKADYVPEEVELTWVQKQALAYKNSINEPNRASNYK